MAPDVTIAIINWNGLNWLDTCLNSILKYPPLHEFELMVVDNGSTDGSQKHLRKNYPNVYLIENAGNLGYAAAANQALRTSKARYVLILNTDIELDSEAVDILIEFADDHEKAAVVGPKLLNPDGSVQLSGRNFPSFIDGFMHAFLGIFWPNNRFTQRYKRSHWDRKSARDIDWVSGAAMLIRREAAAQVGFFDEHYFMYVEDMDLCYRLWQQGWEVYFCPEATAVHFLGQSSSQSSGKMIIEFQRSLYYFFTKRYARSWKRHLKYVVALGLALRGLILLVQDFWRQRAKGLGRLGKERP